MTINRKKVVHVVFGWIVATVAVLCWCYSMVNESRAKLKERENQKARDAELEKRSKERQREEDEFNSDFADIVELARKREKAIYTIIIEKDRKIISWIQDAIESKKDKSSRRKRLESDFLEMFQDEIRECERKIGRIEDSEDNPNSWSNKARNYKGEILKIDCNCPNNEDY